MSNMLEEKAAKIQLLILDVDGVLTDGRLYYQNNQTPSQAFNIQDGLGIKLLQQANIPVAIISGKNLPSTQQRLQELNIEHAYLGCQHKIPAYLELKDKFKVNDEAIAYMGDDLPDLPLLRLVGLAITVPASPIMIQAHADYITKRKGGKGAVREVCELILQAKHLYEPMINSSYDHTI